MTMPMTVGIDNRESGHDVDAVLIPQSDGGMTVDVIVHDWLTWAPKGQHAYRVTTALDYTSVPTATALTDDVNGWLFATLIDCDS